MIILALDALDLKMVKRYRCKSLMQKEHGQTDISEFKLPRTVVLWASFLTGVNMESKIPIKTQWSFKLKREDTFLRFFRDYKAIDVPALTYKDEEHAKVRRLLKAYFEEQADVEEYDETIWRIHQENKKEFLSSIGEHEILIGYFDLADSIGHLSFGISEKMEVVYRELESLAEEVKSSTDEFLLVVSDHGMNAVGRYGDHTMNGFYSANKSLKLGTPRITDFYRIIKEGTR